MINREAWLAEAVGHIVQMDVALMQYIESGRVNIEALRNIRYWPYLFVAEIKRNSQARNHLVGCLTAQAGCRSRAVSSKQKI